MGLVFTGGKEARHHRAEEHDRSTEDQVAGGREDILAQLAGTVNGGKEADQEDEDGEHIFLLGWIDDGLGMGPQMRPGQVWGSGL